MRSTSVAFLSLVLGACGDSAGPSAIPSSIEIIAAPSGSAAAGLPLATSPTFVVKDKDGKALSGVPVTITVTAGGGSVAGAPTRSSAPSTSVGAWTLGKSVGLNSLSIAVSKLSPAVVSITSSTGAPAKIVASGATTLAGTVGEAVGTPISATLKDAFDNAIAGVTLSIAVSGGGSAPASVTTDASGVATVPSWTLGTTKGTQTLTLAAGSASLAFSVAAAAGPIQTFALLSGDNQSALAGTSLPQALVFEPLDQYGNRPDNQVANFSILSGSGTLSALTASSASDGTITMPTYTLGRSALPQSVIASIGPRSVIAHATVLSDYAVDVRFWGAPMTAADQLLFTNAAARIRGIVTGSLPIADATGADPAVCGVTGVPVLAENVPGVIIYASVQPIDGAGKILAQAGPCYLRDDPDLRTVVGVMEFDADDLASLSSGGNLQDVITHEMLHVVGFGTFWTREGLLTGFNTPTVAFTGAGGIAGCILGGGTFSCATAVPVEASGGAGTANSHWRESTFGAELMTGFANSGTMPLSVMTVRSLGDIGYTINPAAADPYQIFAGSIRAGGNLVTPLGSVWERGLASPPRTLPRTRSWAPRTKK
jgi:hypothetical protein